MEIIPLKRENKFYYSQYLHFPEVQEELIQNEKIKINVEYLHKFSFENLKLYLRRYNEEHLKYIYRGLYEHGNLDIFKQLIKSELPNELSDNETIRWIYSISIYDDSINELITSIFINQYGIKLLENNVISERELIEISAKYGHLEIIQHLNSNGIEININTIIKLAAKNNQLEIFKYLFEIEKVDYNVLFNSDTILKIISNGCLDIIKYLFEQQSGEARSAKHNAPINERAISWAAYSGYLEIVKYLVEHNAPINERAIAHAAFNGHFDIVKFLFEHNAPIDKWAIAHAAFNGHFDIVKFLFEHNAPIDEYTIAFAAENGHLEIVKYLVEHNAPIDERAIDIAAKNGHLEIVQYLVEHNAPFDINVINNALEHDNKDIAKCLINKL